MTKPNVNQIKVGAIEFILENPGSDTRQQSLFTQPYTLEFIQKFGLSVHNTSYCKYPGNSKSDGPGTPQKHTGILTSLKGLELFPRCSKDDPCEELLGRYNKVHKAQISRRDGQSGASMHDKEKNALPEALVHSILKQWIISKWKVGYRDFLVLDAFAGWGSVKSALSKIPKKWITLDDLEDDLPDRTDLFIRSAVGQPNDLVSYVGFDITQRRIGVRNRTMAEKRLKRPLSDTERVLTDTDHILDYLNPDMNPIMSILSQELERHKECGKLAVLVHASPPCTTFSTAGLGNHRPQDGHLSALACDHDELVKKLLGELQIVCNLTAAAPVL